MTAAVDEVMPRATSWGVTLLRLGGVVCLLAGWIAAVDVGTGGGVLVFAFFAAVAAIYFGAASGIVRRGFMAHVIALVMAAMGVAYSFLDGLSPLSLAYNTLLIAFLGSAQTREYVAAHGPPALHPRGPLRRLDDGVLGPPGPTRGRLRRGIGRG